MATPKKSKPAGPAGVTVRITAKRDGFRRCGIAHPDKATDHPIESFTALELEVLQNDPMLVVQVIDAPAPAGAEGGSNAA